MPASSASAVRGLKRSIVLSIISLVLAAKVSPQASLRWFKSRVCWHEVRVGSGSGLAPRRGGWKETEDSQDPNLAPVAFARLSLLRG